MATIPEKKTSRPAGKRSTRWLAAVIIVVITIAAVVVATFRKPAGFYWQGRTIRLSFQSLRSGELSATKFWVHDSWSGPTGDFMLGDFYGIKLWHKQLGLAINYDPVGAIKNSLPKTVPGLIAKLDTKDPLVLQCVAEALAAFGPDAKPAIPVLLTHYKNGDDFKGYAIIELAKAVGPDSVPILCDALANVDTRIVAKAIETLGEMGTNAIAAVPALSALLTNSFSTNALAAAYSLRKVSTDDHGGVQTLVRLLDDEDSQVRIGAIFVLGEFGTDASEAAEPLLRFLDPECPEIAGWTARTLGMIGPAGQLAIPRLVSLLNEQNATNMVFVMQALGAFRDRASAAIPTLCEIAGSSPESRGKVEAIKALTAIGTNSIPCLLTLYQNKTPPYTSLSRALASLGPDAVPAVPVLLQELDAKKPYRAAAAAMALGSIGGPARLAVPRLTQLLECGDSHLRLRAAEGLWRIDRQTNAALQVMFDELDEWSKRPSALTEYAEDTHGESGQQVAARVLGEIGPTASNAVPLLRMMQRSSFDQQRVAATKALMKIGARN